MPFLWVHAHVMVLFVNPTTVDVHMGVFNKQHNYKSSITLMVVFDFTTDHSRHTCNSLNKFRVNSIAAMGNSESTGFTLKEQPS